MNGSFHNEETNISNWFSFFWPRQAENSELVPRKFSLKVRNIFPIKIYRRKFSIRCFFLKTAS